MIPVLDIGGTHVTAALVEPAADEPVRARRRRPLDAQAGAREILAAITGCAAGLAAPPGAVWGVSVPGPFDYERGVGRFAGVGKFEALRGVDVGAALRAGLPGPPGGVVFRNDAECFLLGEWRAGAARGLPRCVGITLGTGVGSAFLGEGRMHHEGPGVPPEGRVDLLRPGGRPLEDSVSRRAILAAYGEPGVDVHTIAERARAGQARARRVLDEAFGALGTVLGPRLAAFGATGLVVGGSMAQSWDLVGPALRAGLGDTAVRVLPASLGADAPLIGAAHVATSRAPATG